MAGSVHLSLIVHDEARKECRKKNITAPFSQSQAKSVRKFHRSFPQYQPTPLVRLTNLAHRLSVSDIYVKDESKRFGLKAFKVLGATHAVAHVIAERIGVHENSLSFGLFESDSIQRELSRITLVTATDGNHGRAVAWAAQILGCRAVIYMPKGSALPRIEAIREHGAAVQVIDGNYDDAVHIAAERAREHHWILVQDTAWEGYEDLPLRIIQGYLTIMDEALEQLDAEVPTHVFVQCGVGSLAAAMQAYLVELFGANRPKFIVVEPLEAACFYESMAANDGHPHKVGGDLNTIMAGLACGEPNILAWRILQSCADGFIACDDSVALSGMRILGNPLPGDEKVVSGESGAVTAGLLAEMLGSSTYSGIKDALELNQASRVLLISTEGDTDPDIYKRAMSCDELEL
jgi:diaminopropionate ammonia-lyase